MSSEKTLQSIIIDLTIELNQLSTRLIEFKEIQERCDAIQNALQLLRGKYNVNESSLIHAQEKNNYSNMSCLDMAYEYLLEQQRICSTREIAEAIYAKGLKTTPERLISTTSSALTKLYKLNKINKVRRGFWNLLTTSIDDSNEHEQL